MNILIGLGLTLFVALGIQTFRIGALKEEIAQKEAAIATATAAAEREARTREAEMADAVRKASDVYAQNLKRAQAGAASARTDLERLRDAAGSPRDAAQDSAAAAGADDAARARLLLGSCGKALTELAEIADAAETKLIGLQDYVRGLSK
jgi:Bacteriophage Rz lysis protein